MTEPEPPTKDDHPRDDEDKEECKSTEPPKPLAVVWTDWEI